MSRKVVSIRLPPEAPRTMCHAGQEHWVHQRSTAEQGELERHDASGLGRAVGWSAREHSVRSASMAPAWTDGPAAIRQCLRRTWPKRISIG
jgi:hypothetical protein